MSLMIANAHIMGIDWRHGVGQSDFKAENALDFRFVRRGVAVQSGEVLNEKRTRLTASRW